MEETRGVKIPISSWYDEIDDNVILDTASLSVMFDRHIKQVRR